MGVSSFTLLCLFLLMAASFPHAQNQGQQIPATSVAVSKTCVTASDVIGAILEPAVQVALVSSDICLISSDFEGFRTPLSLDRNLTLLGYQVDPQKWPVLDLGNTNSMIRLGPGVVLNFSRLVLQNWRNSPHFQAPGIDIVAVSSNSAIIDVSSSSSSSNSMNAPPIVIGWNLIIVHRTCLPVEMYLSSVISLPRPSSLPPGNQNASQFPDSPTCDNRSSAPPASRCWPGVGEFYDVGFQGMHLDAYGKPVQSGYIAWLYQAQVKCVTVISSSCMATYGAVACYYSMFPRGQAPGPLSIQYDETNLFNVNGSVEALATGQADNSHEQTQQKEQSSKQQQSQRQQQQQQPRLILALLVGLLGGGLFLAGLAGLTVLVCWRRGLHPQQHSCRSGADALPGVRQDVVGASRASFSAVIVNATQAGDDNSSQRGQEGEDRARGPVHTALNQGRATTGTASSQAVEGSGSPNLASTASDDFGKRQGPLPNGHIHGCQPSSGQGLQSAGPNGTNQVINCISPERASPIEGAVHAGTSPAARHQPLPLPPPHPLSHLHCLAPEVVLEPVTSVTPLRPGVRLAGARMEAEVQLLPVTLGKGAFGKVVKGVYGGEQVAVKLLNTGLIGMTLTGFGSNLFTAYISGLATEVARATGAAAMDAQAGNGGLALRYQECAGDGGAGSNRVADGNEGEGAGPRGLRGASPVSGHSLEGLAQEVEILARCEHPNIIRLLAASLDPPHVCLVMELMDTSLDRLLHSVDARSLPLDKVLHIGIQIARALAYLHPTVLHRDLKPGNVLISQPQSEKPIAKLADFGLSRLLHTVLVTRNPEVGTGPYIAPEAFDVTNSIITDRADVYALGVILWEMLTGARPWYGQNTVQIAFAITVNEERLPLHELPFNRCPPKLRALLLSCWEHDPARRPAAAEVVKTLALIQEGLVYGHGACPPTVIEPCTGH